MTAANLTPTTDPETIAVREGENFDQARLAAYLTGKLPDSERPLEVVQFAGGHEGAKAFRDQLLHHP